NEIKKEPWAKGLPVEKDFWLLLMEWIDKHVLPEFLDNVIGRADEIIEINVELSEQQILEKASEYIVDLLGALSASVRIYDPQTEHILYYVSFPSEEKTYEASVPLEGSITGYVLKSRQPYLVPGIIEKGRYQNKETINRKGVNSLMAIPLEIPRFFPSERDAIGVMQINFAKKKRTFTPLEIRIANLLAKRLSFVIVRKRILSMHKTNEKKESIVQHIYHKVGTRGGIRMKEVFNRVIPELADMVNIQSAALFSVTDDNNVVLETGYPDEAGYHSIGKNFPVSSEPTYEVLLSQSDYSWKSAYDTVTPSYILVVDPQRSGLISENARKFCSLNNINSILYIPLNVGGEITHFMTFDALDQRRYYSEEEIDIFMFLSRELMKARRMERLDDALHDF
ncbi:GAF domain-containing protein, partial [bacterium]|nr:GAF domain-containing protein [bacterium]